MNADPDPSGVAATLAATVVPIRVEPTQRARGDARRVIEILMIERQHTMSFAAGAWVFPGGRVDPADVVATRPADRPAADGVACVQDDPRWRGAAERVAAARELREEAGLVAEPSELVRLSHWTPPPESPTRYSTAFFAVAAPSGPVVLDRESSNHRWIEPHAALAAHAAGDFSLTPPTYITLVTLADLATRPGTESSDDPVGRILELVDGGVTEHFSTRIASDNDALVALYHGDAGYEHGDAERTGPRHRLRMSDAGWRYERDVYVPGPPVPSHD